MAVFVSKCKLTKNNLVFSHALLKKLSYDVDSIFDAPESDPSDNSFRMLVQVYIIVPFYFNNSQYLNFLNPKLSYQILAPFIDLLPSVQSVVLGVVCVLDWGSDFW